MRIFNCAPPLHRSRVSCVYYNLKRTALGDFSRLLSAQWPPSWLYLRITWGAFKPSPSPRLSVRPIKPASLGVRARHLCILKAPQVIQCVANLRTTVPAGGIKSAKCLIQL